MTMTPYKFRDSRFLFPKVLVQFEWDHPNGTLNEVGLVKLAIFDQYLAIS